MQTLRLLRSPQDRTWACEASKQETETVRTLEKWKVAEQIPMPKPHYETVYLGIPNKDEALRLGHELANRTHHDTRVSCEIYIFPDPALTYFQLIKK